MSFNPRNIITIGHDLATGKYLVKEMENIKGRWGAVKLSLDGTNKDARDLVAGYIRIGYKPENIIYNGQPINDFFQKFKVQ